MVAIRIGTPLGLPISTKGVFFKHSRRMVVQAFEGHSGIQYWSLHHTDFALIRENVAGLRRLFMAAL